ALRHQHPALSEHQAELLCRRAAGEWINDAALDWPTSSRRSRTTWGGTNYTPSNHFAGARAAPLKAEAWPLSRAAPYMRRRIDIVGLYAGAVLAFCWRRWTDTCRCRAHARSRWPGDTPGGSGMVIPNASDKALDDPIPRSCADRGLAGPCTERRAQQS